MRKAVLAAVTVFGSLLFGMACLFGSAPATAAPQTAPATAVLAKAAPASHPVGSITAAAQSRVGTVTVTGWTYDTTSPAAAVRVCVWANSRCIKTVTANLTSAAVDRARKITGRHGYRVTLAKGQAGRTVVLRVASSAHPTLARATISTPGARVVTIARKYVGTAPYRDGGASPKGFDCSGYTLYAYVHANVSHLSHNAQAQRHAPGMRRISRATARPGDLVFYLSGGYAYHVAIYAGHGMQYAAATPRDGIRYQKVWSSAVEYRTDWH
jgi:cell wall-associated NlpC family hydrolase